MKVMRMHLRLKNPISVPLTSAVRSTKLRAVNSTNEIYPFEVVYEAPFDNGSLLISPAIEADATAASALMTRAFAGTPEQVTFGGVSEFLSKSLKYDRSKGVFLVARVVPGHQWEAKQASQASTSAPAAASDSAVAPSAAPTGGEASPDPERPRGDGTATLGRLVGTVSISLSPETRDAFATLDPPKTGAYVSNMSVDRKFRRRGVARALLDVVETECRRQGVMEIFLHVTVGNDGARDLYERSGFQEIQRDSIMVKLRGMKPRALMRKQLD